MSSSSARPSSGCTIFAVSGILEIDEQEMKQKRGTKLNSRRVQDPDITIGERIRVRRHQIDMSQEELGGSLSVSFQQVQKYEKGVNRLSSERLIHLANALQCSVTDLIGVGGKDAIRSAPFSRTQPPKTASRSSVQWPRSHARPCGAK
jgi:DNA-binding transcriptional regulator YiaG